MADNQGLSNSPSPLGGAALRQARRRDPYLFPGPRQTADNAPGLWTQFSGMPNQPGSPTSLHEWLQSVDDAVLTSDAGPTQGFPASSSSAASSRSSPLDTYTAADFLSPGIGQDRTVSASPSSDMGHRFDFSSQPTFGSSPDFGSPADYATLHSSQFPSSPSSHMLSMSADISRLPPTDFSQPPPDFSFRPHHDFSQPPPSYVPLSQFSPAVDPHLSFSDFLTSQPNSNYPSGDAAVQRVRHHSSDFSNCEHANLSNEPLTSHHNTNTLSHPAFSDFSTVTDDIFQGSVGTETSHQNGVSHFERATSPHRKVQRQNSEPMFGGAAADEGKAMYMEAFRRLNSLGPAGSSYEQFGSTVGSTGQPHSENTQKVHPVVDSPPALVSKPTKTKELPSKDPTKPSYSDVAKASKSKSSHHTDVANEKSEPERENVLKNNAEPSQSKPHRHQSTRRAFSHTRIINQRSKGAVSDSSQNTYIQPNSRYGLDQFEDLSDLVGAELRSSSVESLNSQPQQSGPRRNSNSSLSSSTSAVEEGHGSKMSSPCAGAGIDTPGGRDTSGKDTPQDRVYNNTSHDSTPSGSGPAQHKVGSSTSHSQSAAPTTKSEKLFFDPKRIFQNTTKAQSNLANKTKPTEEKGHSERESTIKEETVLNNGKPNNTSSKASASSHRKTDYINNDLREGSSASSSSGGGGASKRTNQTAAFNRHGHGSRKNSTKDTLPQNGSGADRSRGGDARGRRPEPENEDDNSFIRNIDWVLVDEWMKYISDCSMTFARNSFSAILTLVVYILGFIMYLAMGAIHLIAVGIGKLWALIRNRIFKDQTSGPWTGFTPGADSARKRFGLEENITLPSTGEEAMKRLLACKGKDPYSILGLRADASDEEIKRYYRRQAVLVHPDKNQEPGAEEAFKILGHAFEMIGEPTKRKEYDTHIFEASEAEAAMREFSDLLTKLQEKVHEAANMMRCDHCGGKHRRVPVDRAWYSARFCDRCNIHHSAKEGDVWAESSMLGFLWHYYACMDNNIYDITDWVSCQRENFKHMKANAHPVYYRIQTDSSRRHRQGQSGEADLEDFINRMFNKASMSPDGASHPNWQFPSQQSSGGGSQSNWGAASSSNSASSSSKRSRRKKKRN